VEIPENSGKRGLMSLYGNLSPHLQSSQADVAQLVEQSIRNRSRLSRIISFQSVAIRRLELYGLFERIEASLFQRSFLDCCSGIVLDIENQPTSVSRSASQWRFSFAPNIRGATFVGHLAQWRPLQALGALFQPKA
jgi:hypothetical protein